MGKIDYLNKNTKNHRLFCFIVTIVTLIKLQWMI